MGSCLCKTKKKKPSRKTTFSPQTQSEAQRALNELVETEKDFGLDLKYLVETYLDPLRTEALFFDNTALILLNSVCLDLVQVQGKIQGKLESYTDHLTKDSRVDLADIIYNVGDVFISNEKEFEIFSNYIVAMSRAQKEISGESKNDDVSQFLEKLTQKPKEQNAKYMTMESLLLKPMQRVMLYPLIMERLEKQSEEGTMDKEQIIDAIDSIKRVASQMNDSLKKDEQSGDEYKALLKKYGIMEYGQKK